MSTKSSSSRVFEGGNHGVLLLRMEPESSGSDGGSLPPPKPVLIATPVEGGEYPVVVFLHGYLLFNSFYSHLLCHIASHGFILVAPQKAEECLHWSEGLSLSGYESKREELVSQKLYLIAGPDSSDEIKCAAATTNWLSEGLSPVLPSLVRPNLSKLGLAGHSRGGKVAFALALDHANTSLKFSALMGIDPVDGMDKGKQTPPPVLTYVPHSFDLNMAVLVVGSGLGELRRNPLFPPCAPKGVNHEDFFNECRSPAWYFVAKEYGHLDMLDDETKGIRGKTSYCLCKNGKAREPMRKFVGGIVIAFMKAYLQGDSEDLQALREEPKIAPVELKPIGVLT